MGLFKKKEEKDSAEVRCPNCGHTQKMEKHVLSVFCKRCMQRIVVSRDADSSNKSPAKSFSDSGTSQQSMAQAKCGKCGSGNEVPSGALSVFCKKCGDIISLKKEAPRTNPVGAKSPGTKTRTVTCYTCSNLQSVPLDAMSAFCSGCGNRIELSDFEIKDKNNDKVMTRGRVHVLSSGRLRADVNAMSARIDGEVFGNVFVEDKLAIGAKGRVFGNITARRMELEKGAFCSGNIRLNADIKTNGGVKQEELEKAEKYR
jgi:ribosomal protein S27E